MNKADRISAKQQAEKAAQRHLDYVAKARAQRAEERSIEQRSARLREQRLEDLREQVLARRTAERPPVRAEMRIPRSAATPATEPATRQTAALAPREDKRVVAQQPNRLAGKKPQFARKPVAARAQPRRRSEDRKAFHEQRMYRRQIREQAAGKRLEEYQQTRSEADANRAYSRTIQQEQLSRRMTERQNAIAARTRRAEIQQTVAGERVQQHRQLREEIHTARAQREGLRRQQAEGRSVDRGNFHQQRAERKQVRRELGSQRVEEHRELRASVQSVKNRGAVLRRSEAGRRAEDRREKDRRAQRTPAVPLKARALTLADTSTPQEYQEPADSLSWLHTVESFVVDENGDAVTLRGVNIEGLDSAAPTSGQTIADVLSLDDANLTMFGDLWSVNLVRIPLQPQTILSGVGALSANDLLQGLDDTINALAEANIYTLLALRVPAPTGASATPLPDSSVFDCWSLLAQHYHDEPGVLFEIYASAVPIQGDWLSKVPVLIGTIRRQHPGSLLFVGNGSGSIDTTGLPLLFTSGDPTPNLVYTIRVAASTEFSLAQENSLADLAKSFPVLASDWTAPTATDFDRSAEAAANLFLRESIGWTAGSWNAEPRLVRNAAAHDFAPTRWGYTVQRAMTMPAREPLTKLLPGEQEVG